MILTLKDPGPHVAASLMLMDEFVIGSLAEFFTAEKFMGHSSVFSLLLVCLLRAPPANSCMTVQPSLAIRFLV